MSAHGQEEGHERRGRNNCLQHEQDELLSLTWGTGAGVDSTCDGRPCGCIYRRLRGAGEYSVINGEIKHKSVARTALAFCTTKCHQH